MYKKLLLDICRMSEVAQKPGPLPSEDASPWLKARVGPRPQGAPPEKGTPTAGVPGRSPSATPTSCLRRLLSPWSLLIRDFHDPRGRPESAGALGFLEVNENIRIEGAPPGAGCRAPRQGRGRPRS